MSEAYALGARASRFVRRPWCGFGAKFSAQVSYADFGGTTACRARSSSWKACRTTPPAPDSARADPVCSHRDLSDDAKQLHLLWPRARKHVVEGQALGSEFHRLAPVE